MVLSIFLGISAILMLISLFWGTVETTFFMTFVTMGLAYIVETHSKYGFLSVHYNKKANLFSKKEEVKCYHTQTDCEECFSQSRCPCKDKNILRVERSDNDV